LMQTITPNVSFKHMPESPLRSDEAELFGDRLISWNESAFSIASLGQIVPGYCLVFSRTRSLNLRRLPIQERKAVFQQAIILTAALRSAYDNPVFFEHGSVKQNSEYGCGWDRAHLHVVPFEYGPLAAALLENYKLVQRYAVMEDWLLCRPKIDQPYIMLSNSGAETLVFSYGSHRVSQCVRRLMASLLSGSVEWDWRRYGEDPWVHETMRVMTNALRTLNSTAPLDGLRSGTRIAA
jgi:diadenosine tetraphosphate (Ap4A) HIT family hydrolase